MTLQVQNGLKFGKNEKESLIVHGNETNECRQFDPRGTSYKFSVLYFVWYKAFFKTIIEVWKFGSVHPVQEFDNEISHMEIHKLVSVFHTRQQSLSCNLF